MERTGVRRKTLNLFSLLACLAAFSPLAKTQAVEEHDGSIYFRDKAGNLRQVTDTGRDRGPSLSADGTRIVFVRNLGVRDLGSSAGDAVGPEFGPGQL